MVKEINRSLDAIGLALRATPRAGEPGALSEAVAALQTLGGRGFQQSVVGLQGTGGVFEMFGGFHLTNPQGVGQIPKIHGRSRQETDQVLPQGAHQRTSQSSIHESDIISLLA
jgi:hypothetical protein